MEVSLPPEKYLQVPRRVALVTNPLLSHNERNIQLADAADVTQVSTFNALVEKELKKHGFLIDALQKAIGDSAGINIRGHLKNQALMTRILLRMHASILEDPFEDNEVQGYFQNHTYTVVENSSNSNSPTRYLQFSALLNLHLTDAKLKYKFAFSEANNHNIDDKPRKNDVLMTIRKPVVLIDRKVTDVVTSQDPSLFKALQSIVTLSSHDLTAHQLITSHERIGNSIDFIYRKLNEAYQIWNEDHENRFYPSNYELLSAIIHKEVWAHIFNRYPQVKMAMVRNARRYIQKVNALQPQSNEEQAEQKMDSIKEYLILAYMKNLFFIVNPNDKDLDDIMIDHKYLKKNTKFQRIIHARSEVPILDEDEISVSKSPAEILTEYWKKTGW